MKIAIAGHTGFLGTLLKNHFIGKNIDVIGINRADFASVALLKRKIEGSQVVINLIGATIQKHWTKNYKQQIIDSRVNATKMIALAINELDYDIYLVNGSAIGIYSNSTVHAEESLEFDDRFLARVVKQWEDSLHRHLKSTKFCIVRLGIILGKTGGYLNKILLPFKLKIGVYFGSRKGCFTFVDADDFIPVLDQAHSC